MIKRLLIANRGEIACRVMRTAQQQGIYCIAVYSDADANALHVQMADEAHYIGESAPSKSYLDQDKILQVAIQSQADAVHPGYGFLSENSQFAAALEKNQIIFIGPPASAIVAMGSKSHAKKLMTEAGVPLVPGYHGDDQSMVTLINAVKNTGFPALIKASAGGGGKGMRIVQANDDIEQAILSAKREAKSGFGDDHVLIEKYVMNPRHVEIQIFCDQQGNGLYLHERDCSIQRRHQKVLEEAPAPNLPAATRKAMGEAAVRAAKAIDYVGAGTVEFLYDGQDFYFMEMNTRLQVEHPVTEMITGLDLVDWQLQVAQGVPLPLKQAEIPCHGHAMEVRIYAEDTERDFLPTAGHIDALQLPALNARVRLDTGVQSGDEISPFYDPMIAKLIVHGDTRAQCALNMQRALAQYQIAGLTTNLGFLQRLLQCEDFQQEKLSTHFINEHADELAMPQTPVHLLCATLLSQIIPQASQENIWQQLNGFLLNAPAQRQITLLIDGEKQVFCLQQQADGWQIVLEDETLLLNGHWQADQLHYRINGTHYQARCLISDAQIYVCDQYSRAQFDLYRADFSHNRQDESGLHAPMNGSLIHLAVQNGATVNKGDLLYIMEAMKMEHSVYAPAAGKIAALYHNVGDLLKEGASVLEFAAEEA
ncbi:MAG: acetyl-CoA carboxylase biotin carboxylase subunit [Oceanospirillaceae bacterium]|nr:acetyl-CoA carboxylase biotin carboxylase subunit [Oceanospirillaceae bacterium]